MNFIYNQPPTLSCICDQKRHYTEPIIICEHVVDQGLYIYSVVFINSAKNHIYFLGLYIFKVFLKEKYYLVIVWF